jgi:hypothetical protein
MRLMYSSLIAGVICLGLTVGCDGSSPPENMQKNIQAERALGERAASHSQVLTRENVAQRLEAESHVLTPIKNLPKRSSAKHVKKGS